MTQIQPIQSLRERHERRLQLQRDMEPFIYQLSCVYALMPHPGFKVCSDGTIELLPIAKEWQELISKIAEMRDTFIKKNYPEYYHGD